MKTNTFALILIVYILVTTATQASSENIVKNGDFNDVKSNEAIGWTSTKEADFFTKRFPDEKDNGRIAQIELLKWDPSGAYLSQSVKVQPNTSYRFSFKGRINQGNMRIAVAGGQGEDKVSIIKYGIASRFSMFPFFWDEEWSKNLVFAPNEWRTVSIDFNSGNAQTISISLGVYQRVGICSFDDVSLTKIDK